MADVGTQTDTSSYPRPQPPGNPLDQILKVGQTADVLGNMAVGQGIQQAIQPDGTIDRNILAQVLKGSVAGSMKAPAALSAIEQLRQAGHSADIEAIRNQVGQMDYVGKLLGPLADQKAVTKQQLVDTAGKAINNATKLGLTGYIPDVAKFLQQTNGDPNMTDQQRAKIVRDHHFQSQSVQRQLEAELPQQIPYNTGATTGTTVAGSQRNPQGISMAVEPPPTQPTVDMRKTLPNGKPNPNYGQSLIIGAGTSAPPSITRTDASGRIIPPVRQFTEGAQVVAREPTVNAATGRPMQTPQAAAANGPTPDFNDRFGASYRGQGGPIPTATPPGFQTATEVGAKNSAAMLADLNSANNESQATKAIIGNLEKESKNFTSGPLADYKRIGKSFVNANLPVPESLKKPGAMFDPQSVADQESFNKNIYNLVQSQFRAIGGTGTDSKLESASHTSPSEFMSQVGVKNILSLLKGNQDAIQAKAKAANAYVRANGPQSMPAFNEEWNNNFDPRVFQFKYMSPAQRQDYYNKIDNSDERRELKRRVEYALDNKMVKY